MRDSSRTLVWGMAILLGLLAAGLTYADDGLYFDAALGRAQVDDAAPGLALSDDSNAFRLGVGYDLGSNIAFEAAWVNLGEVESRGSNGFFDGRTDGVTLDARFEFPVTDTLTASAKVGGFFWESQLNTPFASFRDDGQDLFYGLSLDFRASDSIVFSAAWDRFDFDEGSADALWAGLRYRF